MKKINKTNEQEIKELIQNFDRTDYRVHETRYGNILLSKGCEYIKAELNGRWLFDIIAKAQADEMVKRLRIQLWYIEELKRKGGVVVFCTDGARRLQYSEVIHFAILSPRSFQLYVIDRVAMLLPMEQGSVSV